MVDTSASLPKRAAPLPPGAFDVAETWRGADPRTPKGLHLDGAASGIMAASAPELNRSVPAPAHTSMFGQTYGWGVY